jgi:hypothetical protein
MGTRPFDILHQCFTGMSQADRIGFHRFTRIVLVNPKRVEFWSNNMEVCGRQSSQLQSVSLRTCPELQR